MASCRYEPFRIALSELPAHPGATAAASPARYRPLSRDPAATARSSTVVSRAATTLVNTAGRTNASMPSLYIDGGYHIID